MELRHLRYFIAVAEELSFRKAAERLRMAQPPLSRQIQALEEELGVSLFERTRRVVKLSSSGEKLLQEARRLVSSAAQFAELARLSSDGFDGTLRLGVIAPAANPALATILRDYRRRYPGVHLIVQDMTTADQLAALRSDRLDVGLLRPPVVYSELETCFIDESRMVLAVSSDHRLAQSSKIAWSDFHDEAFVLISPSIQHGFYDRFFEKCSDAGAIPRLGQYANDVHTKLWLISAGLGLAPTMESLAAVNRPGLVFRSLPPGLPMVQTLLAWRRGNTSGVLRKFLESFPAYARAQKQVK